MIRRFHEAVREGEDEVVIWSSGTPRREFLHVDDMAAASLLVLDVSRDVCGVNTEPMLSHVNIGVGKDINIHELGQLVAKITGFAGRITCDTSRPDGTPQKLMDVSRPAQMGWRASMGLEDGIRHSQQWFLETSAAPREA